MSERANPSLPSRRAALASTLLLLAAAGCGGEGGQAEVSAQGTEPQQEYLDLSVVGVDEGDEGTALFGTIEFADFGCPHCAQFHIESFPALHNEFVSSGQILWKYIPVTLAGFPNSDLASIAAECAADLGGFAAIRDLLFERQAEWSVGPRAESVFVQYGVQLGLPEDALRTCVSSPEARDRLDENNRIARQIGVSGTPTFIIAGNPVQGAPPLASFQGAIRDLVGQARAMRDAQAAPPAGQSVPPNP